MIGVTTEVEGNRNAFAHANFIATKPAGSKNLAGYGFHNRNVNGKFIYLDHDNTLKWINNSGEVGFLSYSTLNNNPNYQIIHYEWSGTAIAGRTVALGPYNHVVPTGRTMVGIFMTPKSNTHIALSYMGGQIYCYSESYSGDFLYDFMLIIL